MATHNPRSTASIAGHPLHPMIIPFPVAFFVATLACDIVFVSGGGEGWVTATVWLLGAGLVMAALAAVLGVVDLFGSRQIRDLRDAWLHGGGNVILVLIQLYNWYLRYSDGAAAVLPTGLILSLLSVLILLYTGWKGWEMVYRHHVGVSDETDEMNASLRRR